MSEQNGEKPVDLEKILDDVQKNNRQWVPAHESYDHGRKSQDTTVSRTFAPPKPDGGDETPKE